MGDIATALRRVEQVLEKRPSAGLHDDAPATARWDGGLRIVARHANGTEVHTDMPAELGGTGDGVSPGWLFRAGLAACTATMVILRAAAEGVTLTELELTAASRSDIRGVLGMAEANGEAVSAAARDLQLHVRIAAPGVAPERLRALVEDAYRASPVAGTVSAGGPVALIVEVG